MQPDSLRMQRRNSGSPCSSDTEQTIFSLIMADEGSVVPIAKSQMPDDFKTPAAPKPSPESSKPKAEAVELPYKEPSWSGARPLTRCFFEVVKGGVVLSSVDLSGKPFSICGRLPCCDVVLEHPSVSRYHAVVQYRPPPHDAAGFYVYDLGSTHGTFLNKTQLEPRRYYPLSSGHMLRFGGSSRLFILQGPDEDEGSSDVVEEATEPSGIDWGMGDDAVDVDDATAAVNPFSQDAADEETYVDDPKKTLRGWFEREGYELEYEVEEKGQAHFLCRIRLPVDDALVVEAAVKGKKKEAVAACALEACRTLDRRGLLRQATHVSRQKKRRNWENDDFYDSDEDTFLDRTGTIERKRQQRLQRAGKSDDHVETYESLGVKHGKLVEEIVAIEATLGRGGRTLVKGDDAEDDTLDAYMRSIASGDQNLDKKEKSRFKLTLQKLKQELARVNRLMAIARPTSLPPVAPQAPSGINGLEKKQRRLVVNAKTVDAMFEETAPVVNLAASSPTLVSPRSSCAQPTTAEPSFNTLLEDRSNTTVDPPVRKLKHTSRKRRVTYEYDESDPNYAMWLPPEDQTGDGKTCLNLKYGY